ncbi:MAG: transcription termination/antitermination NusG family protein [bacterium]|nr:transcription termination/antitermination NusG family protein [bacterium]MDT8285087.1 transcription termination/antitermination NusG family protein [Thermovirgaceae bacterium]
MTENQVVAYHRTTNDKPEAGRWLVLATKPRQEKVCLEELERGGFESACPLRVEYRWRRRREETVPLFPGYVFVRMSYPDDYHQVRWLRGVTNLVRFGDADPPAVNDIVMKFFIDAMNDDGVVETGPEIVVGNKVQFLTESMRGLVGTVLRVDSAARRVQVLMELLYQATIEVPVYQVQVLSRSHCELILREAIPGPVKAVKAASRKGRRGLKEGRKSD